VEQGLEEYDEHGRAWRQLILKVKSAGPAIGNMSRTSLKFFFMACYDLDRFREFIKSAGFKTTFDLDQASYDELLSDDMALLRFGDRMIRQIMYGEESVPLRGDALEQHLVRRGDHKSTVHDDMERPSMASYDMPLDGEDEEKSK